ncbi:MAG: hypothetical protein KJP00_07620 [Bacteroidia bacterium]|nr:hypothetical protein [Bacteroidia bacterium]
MRARFWIASITLLLSLIPDAAAQISINSKVDTTGMLIGDQQQLHLTIQHPRKALVKSFYASALDTITNFEIIEQTPWDTLGTEPITIKKDITFTIFDSGYYWIPRIPHMMVLNGDTTLAYSNNIPITVQTIQTDSTSLAPIREIKEEPITIRDFIPYIIGAAVMFALIGLIYWWIRRPKMEEDEAVEEKKEIIPAHVIALEKLKSLRDQELWQKGEQKEYHSQLTYIVREYLENRYGITALESTTYEIEQDLESVDFDSKFKDNLREMLSIADLVKFAKAESSEEINKRIIEQAEEFVNATQKQIEAI